MPIDDSQRLARLENAVSRLSQAKQAEAAKKVDPRAKQGPTEKMHDQLSRSLPQALRPLNVGAYSNVVWSYWFPMTTLILAPNSALDTLVQVTQEAAFILTHLHASVYEYLPNVPTSGKNTYNFVRDISLLPLKMTLVDAQSTRQFMNAPESLALFGDYERPRQLVTPNLYLPNSTIVGRVQNDSPTKYYKVVINLLGARVRIDEASSVLSTMVG
jgi:hypothetical protein